MGSFFAKYELVLMLDSVAQRYGKRPSEIACIEDEATAFDFDLAVMVFSDKKRKEINENMEKFGVPEISEQEKLQMQFAKIRAMQNARSPYGY